VSTVVAKRQTDPVYGVCSPTARKVGMPLSAPTPPHFSTEDLPQLLALKSFLRLPIIPFAQCPDAQLISTPFARSAWRCGVWRRAQPTGHPRSRFAENFWRACLRIIRLSRVHLRFAGFESRRPRQTVEMQVRVYATNRKTSHVSSMFCKRTAVRSSLAS
jgi:hypothetical protein